MFYPLRGSQFRTGYSMVLLLLLIVVSGCNSHPPTTGDSFLNFGNEARDTIKSFNKTICVLPEDSDIKLYSAYIPGGDTLPITLSYKDTKRHIDITIAQVPGADSLEIKRNGQSISRKAELYVYGRRINVLFTKEAGVQKAYSSFKTKLGGVSVEIKGNSSLSMDYIKRILEQMIDSKHGFPCMKP